MKKILSLVLAMVMVLGLCTIGAGAAFTDEAKVQYTDAVSVMAGLGILKGYEDGSFQPLKTVTRAEAAKLITYMMLGADNAEKLAAKTSFDDVTADHWAAKYVGYCAGKGIINGLGNGKFDPNGEVTVIALTKMLLAAVGYGKNDEFVGDGWDTNAFEMALATGVWDESEHGATDVGATREEAALFVFNTLWEPQVKFSKDTESYEDAFATFGGKIWKISIYSGILTANQATGADYTVIDGVNYKIVTDTDLIAHDVDVYTKATAKTDDDGNTYFEAYMVDDQTDVYTAGSSELIGDFAKRMGYPTTPFSTVPVWSNYVKTTDFLGTQSGVSSFTETEALKKRINAKDSSSADSASTYFGTLLVDRDGEIIARMKTSEVAMKLTKVPGETFTIGATEYKVLGTYDGIAKGDYVTYITIGDYITFYPTTIKTAVVNKIDKFIFWYYYNNYSIAPNLSVSLSDGLKTTAGVFDNMTSVDLGDTIDFYCDRTGNYFMAKVSEAAANDGYVFVDTVYAKKVASGSLTGGTETNYFAQCVDGEGNIVTYTVEKAVADALAGTSVTDIHPVRKAYGVDTYAVTETGSHTSALYNVGIVLATFVNDDIQASTPAFEDGIGVKIPGSAYYFADDVKVWYIDGTGDNMKVKTSTKLPTTATLAYYYLKSDNTIPVIWFDAAPSAVTAASSYIYVSGYNGVYTTQTTVDGTVAYGYTVYIDGVSTSILTRDEGVIIPGVGNIGAYFARGFYSYSKDTNGIYTLTQEYPGFTLANTSIVEGCATLNVDAFLYKGALSVSAKTESVANNMGGFTTVERIGFDDIDISEFKIVNLVTKANPDTGAGYDLETVEDFINYYEEGYQVTFDYAQDEEGEPVGNVLYIQDIINPAE